jgi:hypothetical protein
MLVQGCSEHVSTVVPVYVFRDPHFAPSGDTLVCVAEQRFLERHMSKKEVAHTFSGCATYRQYVGSRLWSLVALLPFLGLLPRWMPTSQSYVGVWGKRNVARFRRFLRERGAEVVISQGAPPHLRLAYFSTEGRRRRVRELPPNN